MIATCDTTVLDASTYIDPTGGVVSSANLLAAAVISALDENEAVTVQLIGLRSVTSSYFNMILSLVAERHGVDAIRNRLTFQFSSPAQRVIFQRSYDAVLRSFGG